MTIPIAIPIGQLSVISRCIPNMMAITLLWLSGSIAVWMVAEDEAEETHCNQNNEHLLTII